MTQMQLGRNDNLESAKTQGRSTIWSHLHQIATNGWLNDFCWTHAAGLEANLACKEKLQVRLNVFWEGYLLNHIHEAKRECTHRPSGTGGLRDLQYQKLTTAVRLQWCLYGTHEAARTLWLLVPLTPKAPSISDESALFLGTIPWQSYQSMPPLAWHFGQG